MKKREAAPAQNQTKGGGGLFAKLFGGFSKSKEYSAPKNDSLAYGQ